MARKAVAKHRGRKKSAAAETPASDDNAHSGPDNIVPDVIGRPVFSQPTPDQNDPRKFAVRHPSDGPAYKAIDELNRENKLKPIPFPPPRGMPEPVLTLAKILNISDIAKRVAAAGQIVFHAVGDTGNTRGPADQNEVADKMTSDFEENDPKDVPLFFFHLGDVIYSFGEAAYYYDQFYEPYRNYPAPILALAGNHDGMVAPGVEVPTLDAFLKNFCEETFVSTPEAGGLARTAQIQPGVFFTFEAPLVRILALYSNTLEDPGVIAGGDLGHSQLDYLTAALQRVARENYSGALIIAHHHPAYTAGSRHGWSIDMLAQIDKCCKEAGVWPHAVLSAHAHNYQRFTRAHGQMLIPYIIAGNGGHGIAHLVKKGDALRVPTILPDAGAHADQVVLESYDDQNFGYLRIVVTTTQLRIEYHPASDGAAAKTPDDFVTVDLASRKLVHFTG